MKSLRPLLTAGALAILAACSSPAVHVDYDAGAAFPAYRTYAWRIAPDSHPGRGFETIIVDGRVQRAVDTELAAKGYTHQGAWADPDFLVIYRPRPEGTRSQQVHLGLGLRLGPLGIGLGGPVGDPHRLAVGGILLEIEDFRSQAVIWKAAAAGALQESDSPEEAEADVTAAVHTMFRRFPPT